MTRRASPFGAENNPRASKNDPEGAQWGGARFTPHKNVVIGRRGGKPLAKFLREGVLAAAVAMALVAWAAMPVAAVAPVEAAWWSRDQGGTTTLAAENAGSTAAAGEVPGHRSRRPRPRPAGAAARRGRPRTRAAGGDCPPSVRRGQHSRRHADLMRVAKAQNKKFSFPCRSRRRRRPRRQRRYRRDGRCPHCCGPSSRCCPCSAQSRLPAAQ